MDREQAKELLPAITHFAEGGELWWYNPSADIWTKQTKIWCSKYDMDNDGIINIIKDKHFEARKADALGEEVEHSNNETIWNIASNPDWLSFEFYQPKPKELYEWQVMYHDDDNLYVLSDVHYAEEEIPKAGAGWTRFEPSKRLRSEVKLGCAEYMTKPEGVPNGTKQQKD